jgi:UDP-N-acetylglucosamine:LPS N-acetylglucosamine transferase
MFGLVMNVLRICRRYKVSGVISTGPGLCIIPMLLMRLMGYKTVFVETFCRFNSRSMTGRVMYKIAHRFLIQNKQLQALYPDADYCGRI